MNDQVILRVTKRNGGLEVNTSGTGNDQLAAIRVAAAATFRVLVAARRLPDDEEEMPRRTAAKYHNRKAVRITAEGNTLEFDSQKEARRYDKLVMLLAAGKIRDLKLQPEFTLQEAYTTLEGVRVRAIRYRADFSYERATEPDCCGEVHWLPVVEDVKSEATKTRVYAIKRNLMHERLGIDVREV